MLLQKKSLITNQKLRKTIPIVRRNGFSYDFFHQQENIIYKTNTTYVNKVINAPSIEISINDLVDQIKKMK